MDVFEAAQRLMLMTDESWARHANPWSGLSRAVGSIAVFLAFWSYHWVGWLFLIPVALAILWTWLNPRLFPPPNTSDSWMTKGVLGERVYLNRSEIEIPTGYRTATAFIHSFSFIFLLIGLYGFYAGEFWTAFAGWHGAVLAKMWWVDRMVRLWETMKDKDDRYRSWDRAEW